MNKNVNAIRTLSIDMINKANSGHPGICMGAAPMMYSLFAKEMKIYSKESKWFNRDRFVLAAGHGSAMLYSSLHLSGYDVSMDDLKEFRQLNSKTPGHPEITHTDGIDATSGPLGQGIGQAVGIALAEAHMAAKYNKDHLNVIDHYTYVLCGDGDLQEGVSAEASSLAGHLGLNKLIILWDSNDIQLDASTNVATTEDILKRYESYGFNTILVKNGDQEEDIIKAIDKAKKSDKPTLIEVKTTIGFGSPATQGTPACHGAPIGEDEAKLAKENYAWDLKPFTISDDIYNDYHLNTIVNGEESYNSWNTLLDTYKDKHQELYNQLLNDIENKDQDMKLLEFDLGESEASRVSSGKAINNIAKQINNLIGGSADLSKSNNSLIHDTGVFGVDSFADQNISYGVREFAMGTIANGIMLHGGLKTFCATFFVFSDYVKPAIRMSAIQNLPTTYVFTHDSVAVGEDGPTHEPIEQLSGLRAIPNVNVIRPCDANETQQAWDIAIKSKTTPTVLVLSRQNLEVVTTPEVSKNLSKGAYIVSEVEGATKTLIASGSEVKLAIDVQASLKDKGILANVVSMPCMNTFDKQSQEYQDSVLGNGCKGSRVYIEMASAAEGYKYAKHVIGINSFGASGPGNEVIDHFGFNEPTITKQILELFS